MQLAAPKTSNLNFNQEPKNPLKASIATSVKNGEHDVGLSTLQDPNDSFNNCEIEELDARLNKCEKEVQNIERQKITI